MMRFRDSLAFLVEIAAMMIVGAVMGASSHGFLFGGSVLKSDWLRQA